VNRVYGGDFCTLTERDRFFSYRREKKSGRMGAFIWLE
jgi:copper oxidase (laccase) domain-containing protein